MLTQEEYLQELAAVVKVDAMIEKKIAIEKKKAALEELRREASRGGGGSGNRKREGIG